MGIIKCEVCGFESGDLEEICYWDINGYPHFTEYDIDRHMDNPDALAHILCNECAEEFDFSK